MMYIMRISLRDECDEILLEFLIISAFFFRNKLYFYYLKLIPYIVSITFWNCPFPLSYFRISVCCDLPTPMTQHKTLTAYSLPMSVSFVFPCELQCRLYLAFHSGTTQI